MRLRQSSSFEVCGVERDCLKLGSRKDCDKSLLCSTEFGRALVGPLRPASSLFRLLVEPR
jgi:hypothetical protein